MNPPLNNEGTTAAHSPSLRVLVGVPLSGAAMLSFSHRPAASIRSSSAWRCVLPLAQAVPHRDATISATASFFIFQPLSKSDAGRLYRSVAVPGYAKKLKRVGTSDPRY